MKSMGLGENLRATSGSRAREERLVGRVERRIEEKAEGKGIRSGMCGTQVLLGREHRDGDVGTGGRPLDARLVEAMDAPCHEVETRMC
jgi:hypothetical protein